MGGEHEMTDKLDDAMAVSPDELRHWRVEIVGEIEITERELHEARVALKKAEDELETWQESWRRTMHRASRAVGDRTIASAFENRLIWERRRQELEQGTRLAVGSRRQAADGLSWRLADLRDAIGQIDNMIHGKAAIEGWIERPPLPMRTAPPLTFDPLVDAIPYVPPGIAAPAPVAAVAEQSP